MAIKKSELYSSLWKSCDELRGGMDASQYKDYVLVLLFVKYVSDKAASQKGYLLDVPKGGSFADIVALIGQKDIGDGMRNIVTKLAEANDLVGIIDVADWNDGEKLGKGKDMVDRLSNLVGIFKDLDFGANRADGDDLLGDAYEYLMRHFATESGKSKGQFYTPAEVSRIMAKVIGVGSAKSASQTIHDPTCGSGSLLLKAHDEAKHETGRDLAVYGQEMDNATRALAKMNLILHDCPTGEVWQDNTLSSPHFKDPKTGALKTFDFVVANPPFSTKAWTNGFNPAEDLYDRFAFGVPPPKNGDYAFLLHILACLKSAGKGAVILPHGVLFRGGAEATIRREILRRGYIKGIIGLPANLFYGTGIPACILVLDKEGAAGRKGVFMVDASKGFMKDGPKNRLRAQDLHKIVDTFTRQLEVPRYARMVSLTEISDPKNNFNLNLPRYVDTSEPEDIQDIDGHLRGGIPDRDLDALERYWKVFPGVREVLFKKAGRGGYAALKVDAKDIKGTIFGHPEFTAWSAQTKKLFARWKAEAAPQLRALRKGDKPKALIETLAEDLLVTFEKAKLVDPYDVYQHLMDHWSATMQDDVYLIVSDGWREAAKPRLLVEDKANKVKEKADFAVGKAKFKAELVPTPLVVARFFAREKAALDALEAEAAAVAQAMEELSEEHGGEDGLLADAKNDKDKVTKASVAARLRDVKGDNGAADERKVLEEYLALAEKEGELRANGKAAEDALNEKLAARYAKLTEDEVKMLVVDDKWMATIEAAVQGELDRVSQTVTGRVRELAERYAVPLPNVMTLLAQLGGRVDAHLARMATASR
jgi:type I restriction enzyme M protein